MRRLLAGLLLCVCLSASALNVRFTLGLNPDGVRSTAFTCVASDQSDCAPPTTATLTCDDSAAPSLSGQAAGSSYSENVRQYFSGSAAATATLAVVTVSGSNAATTGWAVDGDDLEISSATQGVGALMVTGTDNGNTVNCSARNWSRNAASSDGGVAPTIPTGLSYVAGSGSVTISGDCPSDPPPTASRLKQVNLRFNGTGATTAVTSCGAGLSRTLTQQIIGASDGTPASSQTGAALSLGFGGSGINSTADNILAFTDTTGITGDAFATVTVGSLTSAASFPKAGIRVAESNAAGAKAIYCYYQGNSKVRCQTRATDGVSTTFQLNQDVTGTVGLNLSRSASTDQWTFSYSTDGGTTWNAGATFTLAMNQTLYWGAFITSSSAGTNATASLSNWNLNNVARWSYVKATASAVSVDATSQDNDNNVSSYSGSITATPNVAADPPKKWHPGPYMTLFKNDAANSGSPATRCNEAAAESSIKGIQFRFKWADLEPLQGDYDFDYIDAAIAACKPLGERIMIQILDRSFGASSVESARGTIPDYIIDTPTLGASYAAGGNNGHVFPNLWREAVMTRIIELGRALAAEYDDEPYVEAFFGTESILGWGTTTSKPEGYSAGAVRAQLIRWMEAMQVAWPRTNVGTYFNWLDPDPSTSSNIALAAYGAAVNSTDTAFSGPDIFGTVPHTNGQKVLTGAIGGIDYRNAAPSFPTVQAPTLGGVCGFDGDVAPATINANMATLKGTHRLWIRNTCGSTQGNWTTGILPYLRLNPNTDTACPTNYSQGCDTD